MDLVIIGDGPQKSELHNLAVSLKIDSRVHILGIRSNPYCWLKQADLFVLSSRWEGYPNVLLEAMSLSRPIVVTHYDASVKEVLSDYPDCMKTIVPVGASIEIANAFLAMRHRKELCRDTTQASVSRIVDQYLNVLAPTELPRGLSVGALSFVRSRQVKKIIYLLVVFAIAIFLYRLGAEPWRIAASHWGSMLQISLIAGVAICIQAASFRGAFPVKRELRRY